MPVRGLSGATAAVPRVRLGLRPLMPVTEFPPPPGPVTGARAGAGPSDE
jgi:hypothetical protein